jgi:pimeloyl-ACP methyl ester carboxylesterase
MSGVLRLAGQHWTAEVERRGQGRPVLYLHGSFGLEWSAPLLERLAAGCEVIAPHLPGYGASEGLDRIDGFHDLAVWLDEVLDALGLETAALIGHDFGGAAAAEYGALFPRRVTSLDLIAPLGLWLDAEPVPDIFGLTPGALTRVLFADADSTAARGFNAVPEAREARNEAILRRRQSLIAAAKLLWPIPDKGLSGRLYRIAAPTRLWWGRDDRLMGAAYAEAFAGHIAGAQLHWLAGGHMLPLEEPAALAAGLAAALGA